MQVCSMLIPCIEPTNTDAASTVSAGPVFAAAGINNAAASAAASRGAVFDRGLEGEDKPALAFFAYFRYDGQERGALR